MMTLVDVAKKLNMSIYQTYLKANKGEIPMYTYHSLNGKPGLHYGMTEEAFKHWSEK